MNENFSGFGRFERGFADFFTARTVLRGEERAELRALLLTLAAHQSAGHSCLPLSGRQRALAEASGLAASDSGPLVLDAGGLYLRRYWLYETRLARQLAALALKEHSPPAGMQDLLTRYFPDAEPDDRQRLAAERALVQGVSLICGGPGTGKTSTVVRILALLQECAAEPLAIALAAPTGKAAARLAESIARGKRSLPCGAALLERIPERATTLHRLLGPLPPGPYFRHRAENPLPCDVVVADECSMVDLALMSKLVDAMPPHARLILLGDRDQLASVEAGSVLADLCAGLPERTLILRKTYRFPGPIKALAEAVNQGDGLAAWDLLQAGADGAVGLLAEQAVDAVAEYAANRYRPYYELLLRHAPLAEIFEAFNAFRILCANQRGPFSVADINVRLENRLLRSFAAAGGAWYAGRPVMITANNPSLGLFNGDIGLCLPDGQDGAGLAVFFEAEGGAYRKISPARLAESVSAYALTIHKSQGSEFAEVLICLPERVNPVLSRELLYTAMTRAKQTLRIAARKDVFLACAQRRVERFSGLTERIRASGGGDAPPPVV